MLRATNTSVASRQEGHQVLRHVQSHRKQTLCHHVASACPWAYLTMIARQCIRTLPTFFATACAWYLHSTTQTVNRDRVGTISAALCTGAVHVVMGSWPFGLHLQACRDLSGLCFRAWISRCCCGATCCHAFRRSDRRQDLLTAGQVHAREHLQLATHWETRATSPSGHSSWLLSALERPRPSKGTEWGMQVQHPVGIT